MNDALGEALAPEADPDAEIEVPIDALHGPAARERAATLGHGVRVIVTRERPLGAGYGPLTARGVVARPPVFHPPGPAWGSHWLVGVLLDGEVVARDFALERVEVLL